MQVMRDCFRQLDGAAVDKRLGTIKTRHGTPEIGMDRAAF
jgi:hypothetical protein